MGRTKRGKLLVPSLIAVASAIACGGTSISGDSGDDIGGPGSGGASTGASYGGGGPTISSGGANSIPPGGTPYAGGPATGGAVGVLYGCPPSVPPDGSRCAIPPNGLGACEYLDGCGRQLTAICNQSQNWQVLESGLGCNADAGAPNYPMLSCPPARPSTGSTCGIPAGLVSYQCLYPNACGELIETCEQQAAPSGFSVGGVVVGVWSAANTFGDCAGAGGAGGAG